MENEERIRGLRAVKLQFAENTAKTKRLNEELRALQVDPGEGEIASQRADEMGERLRSLLEDRERILRRLTELDPVFSAAMN